MSQEAATEINYKDTLNLPVTEFKMKAGATTREPEIEAMWDEKQVYEKSVAMRADSKSKGKKFILHDGPPYLSSDKIHIGTALNKILKDIVTRYKFQRGYYSPYVPGYDSHGLPIENAVVKNIKGGRKAITEVELRKQCREFALKNLDGQEANFKRLGVWGNWGSPYLTMRAEYEATQAKLFCQMYKDGHVYKGLKPVYWCPTCETALADAEVEYDNHTSHSIYVKFPYLGEAVLSEVVNPADSNLADASISSKINALKNSSFVIWTTTPWTLPANLALSVHPDFNYEVVDYGNEKVIINDELRATFEKHVGLENGNLLCTLNGYELNLAYAQHPFIKDRKVPVLNGTHVTDEAGTGIVHTAPGHGMEDYVVCQQYNQAELKDNPIGIVSPVNNNGVFTEECQTPELVGEFYEKANEKVLEILKRENALLGHNKFDHSYPHCWRCHNPVIYRATDQWFINVNNIRQKALDAIKTVKWIPERGEGRIASMVEGRTDWCISRQRVWGVPIPILTDKATGETVMSDALVEHIYQKFAEHTSDIWWELSAEDLLKDLSADARAELNLDNRELVKEMDIMDVWFDSGISHTAVVAARKEELGELPVELYLEGSDQHRGWFQSALWTSVMINGKAPYKSVLTHGFVMDKNGKKMSKSIGNVVDPNKVINQYGADVLRLWVASVDYSVDSRIGDEMLKQLADVYRKIRNTVRFLMGNINGFNPATDSVPYEQWSELDKYTLHKTQDVVNTLTEAFDRYEFHKYYQVLQNFCVTDLSSLYFDVTKDILYCDAHDAPRRRAVQTVLFELLKTLVPMLVPVMPHMAEDIWQSLPAEHKFADGIAGELESVVLADWPEVNARFVNEEAAKRFNEILKLKDNVNLALEKPRGEGHIGSSLEAGVVVQLTDDSKAFLQELDQDELSLLTITSQFCVQKEQAPDTDKLLHRLKTDDGYDVVTYKAAGEKCNRCWKFLPSVGSHAQHPTICTRCHEAV